MAVSVYQYFDARGRLLYVGVTARDVRRTQEHAETKTWWPQAVGCTIEHYETREEALAQEATLIRHFSPPYNTIHNDRKESALRLHVPVVPGPLDSRSKRPKRLPYWQRYLLEAEAKAAAVGYKPKF